ncbi:hypothetical protein BH10BAC2_BH10BAC2_24050 [soil metagenome]
MRILLFLQRVTFICNLLFLVCLFILYCYNFIGNYATETYVIILGYVLSFFLNLAVSIWELLLLFNRKISIVPKWLRMFNFILLFIQLIYYFLT